jgi:hypothetical protein
MQKNSRFRDIVKYRAGALSLIGILSATFLHTTTFMSQFFYHNLVLGAVAAFAIDAGVVAMSIFKDELLKDGELAWMTRVVTVLVLLASGIANLSEGFKSAYGISLTMDSLMSMDPLTWTQWLAGTIVFPILAYIMCDTVGTRNLVGLKQQKRLTKNKEPRVKIKSPNPQLNDTSLDRANRARLETKQQRKAHLEDFLDEYPDASLTEMANAVGVSSRETVRKYLQEMGRAGRHFSHG